ncbi:hypothetical protein [Croceicoccus sediminis]|uniref:hypothetical protein n=1 Tax=Croceicoccus sediminis TaxID=2571150 RepID=UPI00118368B7|nr:hypothetical protein [Croceicoccus sediminis]
MRLATFLLAPAAVLAISGCGSEREGTVQSEDGEVAYEISEDGETTNVRLNGDEGEVTVDTGANLKPDLPDGLAVYPGATITSASNVGLGEAAGALVTMESADSPEKIVGWYKDQAAKAGYDIDSEVSTGSLRIVSGKTADGREFNVVANGDDSPTTVQLTAGRGL